ncbi:hypothetical protein [Anoxybacteroides amylolyticum]|uniref:DUF4367 domain-containing protein n=1 Tax=Anoxybacteroides amylolyticum TaxID=294699 RepID=A0A160F6A1_9BACL|nr:hypothetical protein [Anoxybacillus amylolyticus]ANB61343.1 hypothetical protein GFC30_12 [Anoxybacillus amylolyticus]
MKIKQIVVGLSLSALLGVVSGIVYGYFSGETGTANATQIKKISNGWVKGEQATIEKVPFKDKVKTPTKIPFDVKDTFSEVVDFPSQEKKIFRKIFFDNAKKSNITIEVTDANIIPSTADPEKQPLIEIELPNGTKAQYLDNGILQFLYWKQDGLFYKIEAQKEYKNESKKYTKEELVEIASSLE